MKPTVTKIQQTSFVDAKGNFQIGYAVTFMVGKQGPYTINIPQNEFNAATVLQQTQAFANELSQIPMAE